MRYTGDVLRLGLVGEARGSAVLDPVGDVVGEAKYRPERMLAAAVGPPPVLPCRTGKFTESSNRTTLDAMLSDVFIRLALYGYEGPPPAK